jgi:2,3-bisphosphoglycerate-independent phosphoglycerate mutase
MLVPKKKAILIVMDGWGLNPDFSTNAIAQAFTPFYDSLWGQYAQSELLTHGEYVGLPDGQMGNSEVGHMNLGAGRVVYQDLMKITKNIESGDFFENLLLKNAFSKAIERGVKVHFIGLVSDGGVHSHTDHLKALIKMAREEGVSQTYIHAFTDGRDTDPQSGYGYLRDLKEYADAHGSRVATIIGRYYAMDRDKRWERVKLAFDLLVNGMGKEEEDYLEEIKKSYADNITDEFIKPIVCLDSNKQPIAKIEPNDLVICFNFRTDRCREITQVLTQEDMHEYNMHTLPLHYITMTKYDSTYKGVEVLFEKDNLNNTLGEVIASQGFTQLRIAETEKYPHVSFFFSGGREKAFDGENRIMISSPKVATYDLQPEMSADEVKDAVIKEIRENQPHFICLNFANTDMVGHTGVFAATMKAAETVDKCVQEVVENALQQDYVIFLTADHGNADMMINPDGSPNTAHTTNPVPLFLISNEEKSKLNSGKLADIAPSILKVMGINIPKEMTGNVLF